MRSDGARVAILLLLAGAVAVGLWARLDGFGSRPLAIDEYYSIRSVQLILDQGLPAFPGGGYYLRGLPWQYATALSAWLFGQNELAYRLPSLLFSLLSIVLAYAYARRFMGVAGAGAVAVALLLSSWHVEFARFARMYTLFQCATLLFLLVLDDVLARNRWPRRHLLYPLALLAMLAHALGLLLAPLLLLPLLLKERFSSWWSWLGYASLSLTTLLLCLWFARFDGRRLGVVDALPIDYLAPTKLTPIFAVPSFPFWRLAGDPWATLGLTLALVALGFAGSWRRRRQGSGRARDPAVRGRDAGHGVGHGRGARPCGDHPSP